MRSLIRCMALVLALSILALGCTGKKQAKGEPVVVATMIDSEGAILGKMLVLLLESAGIPVLDKSEFGTPDILRKALEAKEVHFVVDYTGSGQYYHEGQDPAVFSDPEGGYEATKRLDAAKGISWLKPSPANNTESLAVKRGFAESTGVRDMAALAAYVNSGAPVKLICAQSFADNPLGLIGFEKAYGFKLEKDELILLSSGNTAEMLKALAAGTNGVNVSLVYGTDGALKELDLVVLKDPKSIPPVYRPAPVILTEKLELYPKIASLVEPVFASLELETLQRLNASVAFAGKDPKEVAREYLVSGGFLKR